MKIIMSCSKDKRLLQRPRPFFEIYDGPMWKQLRAAGIDLQKVACVSALYGFMEPCFEIRYYDVAMDQKRSDYLCRTSNHIHRLASWVAGEPALMFGGALYTQLGRVAKEEFPNLTSQLELVGGSFLQQRKRLGQEIRA